MERLEDDFLLLGGNADARIGHGESHHTIGEETPRIG